MKIHINRNLLTDDDLALLEDVESVEGDIEIAKRLGSLPAASLEALEKTAEGLREEMRIRLCLY